MINLKKMSMEQKLTLSTPILGIFLYMAFIALDIIVYPSFFMTFLLIRLIIVTWLIAITVLYVLNKMSGLYPFLLLPIAAFGISFMCYISGDGFQSIYFVGLFLVIISGAIFIRLNQIMYSLLMIIVVLQHFLLQSLIPFSIQDIFINIFFLLSAIVLSIVIKFAVTKMSSEIKTLSGLLPICAYCKNIRDDKGYWNQIESYVGKHSEVVFSHGICPDCANKLYPDLDL